ncbi:MAG: hypothetical protein HYY43_02195 [Deltaproteobacteria bacterium]|nr:hypothetical protein [Deltaproteobacteria bacterium]
MELKMNIGMVLLAMTVSCGGGLYTNLAEKTPLPDSSAPNEVQITKNAFIFGSDFPADIAIPDIENMRDTAFVVTSTNPSGVIAVDLTANPLSVSTEFAGLVAPSGSGYPSSLHIMSENRAFLLTSSHIIDFNPSTGTVNKKLPLGFLVELQNPLPISDNSYSVSSIVPSYPASVVTADSKLYITTSNYINPLAPASASPGTVLVFDILDAEPFIKIRTYIVTTGYNPSGLTLLPDGKIAVTNSGVSDLIDASSYPKTEASIDIIDPSKNNIIANIELGIAGLSFQEMAVTKDGKRGFIGSIAYGEMYEVDFENYSAIHDHSSPIAVTNGESAYLSAQVLNFDGSFLFVSSFNDSTVYPIDIKSSPPKVLGGYFSPEPFILGYESGVTEENPSGTVTGAGPIAIRKFAAENPGPDLFVLTGFPGTIVAINTNYDGLNNLSENPPPPTEPPEEPPAPDDLAPPPEANLPEDMPPPENTELPKPDPKCTGFAEAVIDAKISSGGGLNFNKLPGVVLGAPEPIKGNTSGTSGGTTSGALSLGNGGSIILDMGECEIIDGEGPDFIVFENAFFIIKPGDPTADYLQMAIDDPASVDVFAEPAEVSASEDGVNCNPAAPA